MTHFLEHQSLDASLAQELVRLIPGAVVVINKEQRIVYFNPAAEEIFKMAVEEVQDRLLDVLLPSQIVETHRSQVQAFLESKETVRWLNQRNLLTGIRSDGEAFSFEGTIAKLQFQKGTYLAILMREVTKLVRAEEASKRVSRAHTVLTECLEAINRAEKEAMLLQEICRIAVETGQYVFAWIGYAEEDEAHTVQPLAWAGQGEDYLGRIRVSWADNEYGQGPTGLAIRTGATQFARNIPEDPSFYPWRSQALEKGFLASAAIPLRLGGRVIGALNLYSRENDFDEEEIDLLTRLAHNLAFGIAFIRTRQQRDEEAEQLQHREYALKKRIKELNLFYTLSRLQSRNGLSLEDTLREILEAIPRAWQFPDQASARIWVKNVGNFSTPSYRFSPYSLRESIRLHGEEIGEVEVVYLELPEAAAEEAPFLSEEYELIYSVGVRIGEIVSHFFISQERRKLSGAMEQTADAVLITDREGSIEYVNSSFEALSGYTRDEALGKKPNIVKSGEHSSEFYADLWKTILAGKVFRDTVINRSKDGSLYYEHKTISPLYNDKGALTHFLSTGKDITEQLQSETRLRHLASHDPLTGLINQGEFVRQLDQVIASLPDKESRIAVVAIGMDNFRAINEILGRSKGDHLLRRFAQRLESLTEHPVARLEGDIFSLQIRDASPIRVARSVESLLSELARPLEIDEEEMAVTATAGVSWYPQDCRDGLDLVQKAETAMSRGKNKGVNRLEFYAPEMQSHSLERLRLTRDLLGALERGEFSVFFQPQIDLATGRPVGAEALVRWIPPHRDPPSPEEFLPVLEELGLIGEVGEYVLRSACEACLRMQKAGLEMPGVAVNLSALQLEDPSLVQQIKETLQAADFPAESLELEVTESLLITRYEEVQDRLAELKELGVGVALDDFGTGYSSLQYLTSYPFSKLKIDKSFVWKMQTSQKDREVIRAIVSLGHSLGIRVTAEGAESEEHLQQLEALGCDSVQGYYHSPPVPEEQFREFLRSFG